MIKLLVSMNYSEIMNEQVLQPLEQTKRVSKLYVVHSLGVPKLSKIESYGTPNWLRSPVERITVRGVLRLIAHFILMLYLTATKKPDMMVGFYVFPHGVYSFICSKILRKPVIVYIDDWPGFWRYKRKLIPLLRRCDIIATTGTKTREYLTKQGIRHDRIFILPDSIDVQRFRLIPSPKSYDVIMVGRLAPAKGVDTLLKAVAKVKESKKDLKVGILGDGPQRASLEDLANRLGVADYVEFLGWRNNPEYYYNSARVFVLTSRWEGLPMAMLEAMSCGLMCVVSNVGDVSDVAIDGFNALVIDDPYDVDGFAKAITKLLNDDELRKTLSKNAETIRDKYSYEAAIRAWEKMLISLEF